MCGIFCSINCKDVALASLKSQLINRGPNFSKLISVEADRLIFFATVLWHQGKTLEPQPIDENNQIFLFNGDLFMQRDSPDISDTRWLFNQLSACEGDDMKLVHLFKRLKGPMSFMLYDKRRKCLWFGRDSLGRNSLLIGRTEEEIFITSITDRRNGFIELPPLGIYCYDLNDRNCKLFPWSTLNEYRSGLLANLQETIGTEIVTFNTIDPEWLQTSSDFSYRYSFKDLGTNSDRIFEKCINEPDIETACNQLIDLLQQSVKERVEMTQNWCQNCLESKEFCPHSRVGILFSGGLDCSILAVLADKYIDSSIPIDLINVSFEKPKKKTKGITETTVDWNVPDRKTAIETHVELCEIRPNRKWNLVEVNVTREELENRLRDRVGSLINPLKSVLDESLGVAFWFAARGQGIVNGVQYNSGNRVLLLGSGADELFGGYTRHRNAFCREGNVGETNTLFDELELDWNRLPSRNLARDDRVISDHGVTPRTPYLQEDFVSFVRNLAPLQKCYHGLEQGVGDKLLLRLCAYLLGLRKSSILKKRALQFGSRVADSKQNAKDVSIYL